MPDKLNMFATQYTGRLFRERSIEDQAYNMIMGWRTPIIDALQWSMNREFMETMTRKLNEHPRLPPRKVRGNGPRGGYGRPCNPW